MNWKPLKSFSVLIGSFYFFLICHKQDYFRSFRSFQIFSILFSSCFSSQKWQFWCLAQIFMYMGFSVQWSIVKNFFYKNPCSPNYVFPQIPFQLQSQRFSTKENIKNKTTENLKKKKLCENTLLIIFLLIFLSYNFVWNLTVSFRE